MNRLATTLLVTLAFGVSALAQDGGDMPPMPEPPKPDAKPKDPKKDTRQEDFEKAVKELKRIDGPFPMYIRKKDILMEVPEDRLGKLFMLQATFASGVSAFGLQAGDPLGDTDVDVFRWEKQDEQMLLIRPNTRYRWESDDQFKVANERSFPEATLASLHIDGFHPGRKVYLLNATSLFVGELLHLGETVSMGLGGPYMLDREKTVIEKIKGYPENSVVQLKLHYFTQRAIEGANNPLLQLLGFSIPNQLEDPRSAPIRITYNLWYRKPTNYVPRLADPRVGYFTQDFYSLARFFKDDRMERYVLRFDLRKKDPAAALSEPVKPIVWTIDPSIPAKYRDAVREGILRWNKAFEATGFKNAVVVQDPPEDYDHSDGRFNVVRWTMSENLPYAVSLFRNDPFTGELLSASVTMDANYLAWVLSEHQDFAVPASSTSKRAFDVLLRDKDDEMPLDFRLWATDKELAVEEFERRITKTGWRRFDCRFASGLAESAAFGWNVLASIPGVKISKDDYAKQFISDTISHEVGHCLGLRHNFEASTNLTTAQLADDQLTGREGIAASVMDYTPVNVQAVLRGKGNFYMPTIGPYDVWAIQYGYTPFDAVTPQGEQYRLSKIAARSGQHGMAYMTDENVNRWDPLVVTFDCASDPLNYAGKMLVAAKRLRQYAIENLPRPGDTYEKRTELLIQSFMETMREGRIAARFVGGIHASRSLKGDPGAPPALAPISADEQRQAMKLITANCLASNAFVVPEDVALNMAFDPDVDGASQWTAPLRRIVGRWQMFMLAQVMSADTTDRITENQYKLRTRKNNYTLDEHYGLMLGAVFGDLASGKSLDPVRRDLQRFGVAALIAQAGAPFGAISEDAKTLASDALRRLSSRVGAAAKAPAADELTRVHLRETKAMIDRFLNRQIAATR